MSEKSADLLKPAFDHPRLLKYRCEGPNFATPPAVL